MAFLFSSLLKNHRAVVMVMASLLSAAHPDQAAGFFPKSAPTVTAGKAANLEVRYFTELLTASSQSSLDRQFGPIAGSMQRVFTRSSFGMAVSGPNGNVSLTAGEKPRTLETQSLRSSGTMAFNASTGPDGYPSRWRKSASS
jgi:hypothetical protein